MKCSLQSGRKSILQSGAKRPCSPQIKYARYPSGYEYDIVRGHLTPTHYAVRKRK